MIEAEALAPSALVGTPLRDLDITEGIRIGAVFRQGELLAPTGDTVIASHDRPGGVRHGRQIQGRGADIPRQLGILLMAPYLRHGPVVPA